MNQNGEKTGRFGTNPQEGKQECPSCHKLLMQFGWEQDSCPYCAFEYKNDKEEDDGNINT